MPEENQEQGPSPELAKNPFQLPYILPLEQEIQDGAETITKLIFKRRPVASDYKGVPVANPTHNDQQLLLSRLLNVGIHVIERLDILDYQTVLGVMDSFLLIGPKIGQKSSGS